MLEPVLQGFREVPRGDVFHRVLRGHHLEPGRRAHLPDPGKHEEAFVQRGEEDVLHGFRHPVQLVDEKDGAFPHGPHQRDRERSCPRRSPFFMTSGGSNQPVSLFSV